MDESGHIPSLKGAEKSPNFILAALMIPVAQWQEIASDFSRIKAQFKVRGEIKWRSFGIGNNEKSNSLTHLTLPEKDQLRRSIFEIITKRNSCRIVATRMKIRECWNISYIREKNDIYHMAYKQTLERVEYFLQDISKITGEFKRGIIIADHRGPNDDKVFREYHATITEGYSPFTSDFKHFVERIMLTDSQHSVGIQLADMCAGALSRSFNRDEPSWIEMLRSNIRTHPQKGIDGYGIVHWPK